MYRKVRYGDLVLGLFHQKYIAVVSQALGHQLLVLDWIWALDGINILISIKNTQITI